MSTGSRPTVLSLMALVGAAASAAAAPAPSIEQLTRPPVVKNIKISPRGDYLALRAFRDGKHALVFLDRTTMEPLSSFGLPGRREVGRFHWVNDERVVGEVWEAPHDDERPRYYGELFGTNMDGSRGEALFGYRSGERQVGSHLRRKDNDRAWARIIDVLPEDDRYVLISSTAWSESHDKVPQVKRLNVYSGLDRHTDVPVRWNESRFLTDANGDVRLITGYDDDGGRRVQALSRDGEWRDISSDAHGDGFDPIAIADDGESAFTFDNVHSDRLGVYRLSLDGEQYELVYQHERVDVTDAVMSTDGRSLYALRVDDGFPSYLMLSDTHPEAAVFRQLLQTFQGQLVEIESHSRDGRYWIVGTRGDVNDDAFHLFDREHKTLHQLFDARPDVSPEQLSPMRPVEFRSFDDRLVHGYFTAAANAGEESAPMVVLVHGGPAVRDYWGYQPEVQVLATRGFSVLQINYRGSAGYGKAFEELSAREWGRDVQKDIIAGTRWAIAEGLAESDRVCIMGSSFGAYSAVQSTVLAPDLYQCVVANAGIYDLALMYRRGDTRFHYRGESYLEEFIGRDEDELHRYSPVNRVGELRAPVLIAHGRQDERAPFEHARRLRGALDEHDKPYRWFIKGRESHGFYSHRNQVEYLEAAIGFLARHLD